MEDSKQFHDSLTRVLRGRVDNCECEGSGLKATCDKDPSDITDNQCPKCAQPLKALEALAKWRDEDIPSLMSDDATRNILACAHNVCVNSVRGQMYSDSWAKLLNKTDTLREAMGYLEKSNPNYATLNPDGTFKCVEAMQMAGLWDGFVIDVNPISPTLSSHDGGRYKLNDGEILKLAKLMSNGKLLLTEINSYLEGVE